MNAKTTLILATGLALVLAGTACTRHDVASPSPVGPSTLATVLKVSANPNVINAGAVRSGTTISASLMKFDGTPIADRSVTFEVADDTHNRVNVGFFEGQQGVVTKRTDGGGNVSLTYYGPLDTDIAASTSINIWATAAGEGDQYIENFAPVTILRGDSSTSVLLEVFADPNVLNAGTTRQHATIWASVKRPDGAPIAGRAVYFEINDVDDKRANIGYFAEQNPVATAVTNAQGMAHVTYWAPIKTEIPRSLVLHIWGSTAGTGNPFIQSFAEVFIIR
jgi:hypothetical protein